MKKHRNSFKNMRPNVAKHVGREIFNATLTDSNAERVNTMLKKSGVSNPDGSDVVFSDAHLQQMKGSIRQVFTMVQDLAPHRMNEAYDLVTSMHTGGSYGPWYVKWYIPHALETGAPLWVSAGTAQKIVQGLKGEEQSDF